MGHDEMAVGRPVGGAPGTLRVNDSALRLLATAVPARTAVLLRGLEALQRAANDDRSAVPAAAEALRKQLRALGSVLETSPVRSADRQAMLAAVLRDSGSRAYPDYATAEQAAMAAVVLLADAGESTSRKAEIDALFAVLDDDAAFDQARFARMLGRLGEVAKPRK